MATGDQVDFTGRLRKALPSGWFPVTGATDAVSATPALDGVLSGLGSAWAWLYSSLQFVKLQTRIATGTGVWLDVMALDYFGRTLRRRLSENDARLSARIMANLLPTAGTRAAFVANLTTLTGHVPAVFEPRNTTDTGGWGGAGVTVTGLGYGVAGGWGSMALPFQAFVKLARPNGSGILNVAGYYLGYGPAQGGYGVGAIEYAQLSQVIDAVTDADMFGAVNRVRPVATIVWTIIPGIGPGEPLDLFVLDRDQLL